MHLEIDRDIDNLISLAIEEDVGTGDLTSEATIPHKSITTAQIVVRAQGVIAGLEIAHAVFGRFSTDLTWSSRISDGDSVEQGSVVVEIVGSTRGIVTAERTALNFLGRLSGIATLTRSFVDKIEDSSATIVDTRKTTPGWRMLEKYAVRAGGGSNHRVGLFDMVLIKENHIRAAGGIPQAVENVRRSLSNLERNDIEIEVEITNNDELLQAVASRCDRIMLDNMSVETTKRAVALIRNSAPEIEIEASGNMVLDRVAEVADVGVDLISVGLLTHSAPVLDLSLLIQQP